MPVVRSDKPGAKMIEQKVKGYGEGINTFVVDKQKYRKDTIPLGNILRNVSKHVTPVGIFSIPDLQAVNKSRKPIATIQPDLVVQLMSSSIHVGYLTVGADYHILVKKVTFAPIKDRKVNAYLRKYAFETVASLLHHFGHLTTDFVNKHAKMYDEEFKGSTNYGTRIYMKKHPDAPKYFLIPFFYKFGCRFTSE